MLGGCECGEEEGDRHELAEGVGSTALDRRQAVVSGELGLWRTGQELGSGAGKIGMSPWLGRLLARRPWEVSRLPRCEVRGLGAGPGELGEDWEPRRA